MTVEVKADETQVAEVLVREEEAKKVVEKEVDEPKPRMVEKSSSYKEESNFLSDLKEFEKKALIDLKAKVEEAILGNSLYRKEEPKKSEKPLEESAEEKEKPVKEEEEGKEEKEAEESNLEDDEKEKEGEKEENPQVGVEEKSEEIDRDISIWGVPLLPSKGAEGTDVVLLKFLRAREFKVNEAFEMLKKTLQWRKDSKIDSILDEELCADLSSAAYVNGVDREGHPVCYNIFGVFENEELYQKTFGTQEKRSHFLRWRCQLMEKSIQKLDLKPSGVSSLLHVNDLKNSPGPSKKELRIATKQAVGLLQDNYPELVAKNIFINVPFWYYALNALLSPFLTQRTKSKFVIVRPAKVTETLLKYIPAEEIPVQYGGFKRENDFEFYGDDNAVSELFLKAGMTETIEIPAPEVETTLIWDLTVLGWEVNYKEEFVPNDEGSYTIIVQKGKKMGSQEGPLRNTFRTNEPGKVVLTIENTSSKKKRYSESAERMSSEEFEQGKQWLNDTFYLIRTETEYVSQMLTKVKRFAQHHSCHVWFVAHPRQLHNWVGGPPNLYDISGSAHFINKCDNGIVVHRNRDPDAGPIDQVQIFVRKVRNKVAGTIGDAFLLYDRATGQFIDVNDPSEGR